jgi:hypothetical protein
MKKTLAQVPCGNQTQIQQMAKGTLEVIVNLENRRRERRRPYRHRLTAVGPKRKSIHIIFIPRLLLPVYMTLLTPPSRKILLNISSTKTKMVIINMMFKLFLIIFVYF